MKQQFEVYIKKLTPQELGYRKGRLMTGGYFYISKSAVGNFFKELDKYVLNDYLYLFKLYRNTVRLKNVTMNKYNNYVCVVKILLIKHT
jgi:hypothetical protein